MTPAYLFHRQQHAKRKAKENTENAAQEVIGS